MRRAYSYRFGQVLHQIQSGNTKLYGFGWIQTDDFGPTRHHWLVCWEIANLITAWCNKNIPGKQRKWCLLGAGGTVLVIIASFAYFVPTLIRMEDAGQVMVSADVVHWWVRLNWLRAFVYTAAWFATLRAFSFGQISGE